MGGVFASLLEILFLRISVDISEKFRIYGEKKRKKEETLLKHDCHTHAVYVLLVTDFLSRVNQTDLTVLDFFLLLRLCR